MVRTHSSRSAPPNNPITYLWQLRSNFIRMTDRDCVLPKHGLEEQARVLFGELAKIGALEVLENG